MAWPTICPESLIEPPTCRSNRESFGMRRLRSVLVRSRHTQARKLKLQSAVNPTASPLLFKVPQQGMPVRKLPGIGF